MNGKPRENPWEKLKRKDEPTFYVATRYRWRWREEDAFWRASEPMERYLWDVAYPMLSSHRCAVIIGAGAGRLAVRIAKHFTRVMLVGPGRMVVQLRERCQQFGVCNVEVVAAGERWSHEPVDLVCSVLHYPHIAAREAIASDVATVASCLRGVALVHVDTVPRTRVQRFTDRLPRNPLAHDPGRTPVAYHRDAADLRALFAQHELRIAAEFNRDSPRHVFALTPFTAGA